MGDNLDKNLDLSAWNILSALDLLCKKNATCSDLRGFLAKQIWNKNDRQTILQALSKLFLNLGCVCDIGSYFRPLILDIAQRTKISVLKNGHVNKRLQKKFAVALGLVLPLCPELERFTAEFIKKYRPFEYNLDEEPLKKKTKREKVGDLELCQAVFNIATQLRGARSTISVKLVADYLSHQDPHVKWFAALIHCTLIGMSEQNKSQFLHQIFSAQEVQALVHWHFQEKEARETMINKGLQAVRLETLPSMQTHTQYQILPSDLDGSVISVTGVLLPAHAPPDEQTKGGDRNVHLHWVGVPSMMDNLRSLALAVSAGSPVLVQGPVGCGKTLLVQYLAALTGRHSAPDIIKVQLSDQTDSKALLGTYQCTEVPGQFVWRPGVLMEAVSKGYWVLLEDLDHAPMEVVSILAPLLQTSTLSVPGHGDLVRADPGFQLFATQRLFAAGDGLHSQNKNSAVLDKLWTQLTIQPLSRAELKEVVTTRFPNLSPIANRLLEIYFMLSAGRHHLTSDPPDLEVDRMEDGEDAGESTVGKFLSLTGRLVSTRDLMLWCSHVSERFVATSADNAELVFQAALDYFVSCLPSPSKRQALAEAIAAKLNLPQERAEYFLAKRKPMVDDRSEQFSVGDVLLPRKKMKGASTLVSVETTTYSYTRPAACLLEKVAACVLRNEPVLLVGETGTGKTSSVQYLAQALGHKLHVINLNQQSDSVDLLGGFKPVDVKFLMMPLKEEFEALFSKTFSQKQNLDFLRHLQNCFTQKRWHDLLVLMEHSYQGATKMAKQKEQGENGTKWQKLGKKWQKLGIRLKQLKMQVQQSENVLAFSYMEGTLVKALKSGSWVLLDEINLAAAETLQCLVGLLESSDGSLVLTDRGIMDPVVRHPDFRLFACMNPATDVGKKDLTPGIRNRFTEFYVDELEEPEDLRTLVRDYLAHISPASWQLNGIVNFYLDIRRKAATDLVDGTGHRPHYSLRTLCRALKFVVSHNCGTKDRSLYEGFCLSFLTQLDRKSHPVVTQLICEHILDKSKKGKVTATLAGSLPRPTDGKYVQCCGYWISQGALTPSDPDHYIITPFVKENLKDLARIVSAGSHPVLLQGETSVGKTSMITYLAQSSGNHCVRVNNHEHTDLQEYLGCYAADRSGKLVFKEGVLVEAMRKGHWIILDELNLAPTDVLEALNRLLDDNQELFIPETQEVVKAHPKFMLFATQNPPGHYGGRKMLSRAFRNRFVELHFDEIPKQELVTILHQRCGIPESYAKRLVAVMADLQVQRQQTGLLAGKQSWMTLRDLFRWAERYHIPYLEDTAGKYYDFNQLMADQGYLLLAGRVRRAEEVAVIETVLKKHFKNCRVGPDHLFNLDSHTSPTVQALLEFMVGNNGDRANHLQDFSLAPAWVKGFEHVVWTRSLRRLAVLIGQAIQLHEPVLLVGDTGCGKTTLCQMFAAMQKKKLHSVGCHLHTESADFLGGLRPVRSHDSYSDHQKLFEWVDGPLVKSMKEGSLFLIDEISLADDSVLERLNSVLEPEKCILLAEKGGGLGLEDEVEVVKAEKGFQIFATMNPGGDFGKKELSPALRNRFTEIWCPQSDERDDLVSIIDHNIQSDLQLGQNGSSGFGAAIMDFITWFSNNEIGKRCTVSIRNILTWVQFINVCSQEKTRRKDGGGLDPAVAFIHGACLVFLDSLGSGTTSRGADFDSDTARSTCLQFLQEQVRLMTGCDVSLKQLGIVSSHGDEGCDLTVEITPEFLTIHPFSIPRECCDKNSSEKYAMQAPTTCFNAQRILRGLQLPRPLLLEGAPGVGKTSLVAAVARLAGRKLIRINLSEQTDVTDLFGADLPVEGGKGGVFAWRDGPFLQALKAGDWVVFDEMNLASQSVLEGLNACLDHRGEVFIPELGRTFHIQHDRTRIFACQNPLNQGGGRKGLPRSFLNRFTQVYVEPLMRDDLIFICCTMYPSLPQHLLAKMVDFNMKMYEETMVKCTWGRKGSPWEFNLRDISRWCDLLLANQSAEKLDPGQFVFLIYQERMRTAEDKLRVAELYCRVFGTQHVYHPSRTLRVTPTFVQAGQAFMKRGGHFSMAGGGGGGSGTLVLHHLLEPLESLVTCVNMGWMSVLVGTSSSGKSSLVHLLSELCGHRLHVLPMSSDMDTTELLGGFEQMDIGRHIAELSQEVVREVRAFQQDCLLAEDMKSRGLLTSLDEHLVTITSSSPEDDDDGVWKEVENLTQRVHQLQGLINKLSLLKPNSDRLMQLSAALNTELAALEKAQPGTGSVGGGTFEWVDSLFVKALRSGDWLLIDNVNFCSPSVLDRLNALLEPGGVLAINERGVMDGEVMTIAPHPNFRLFLSMDPKNGEISRAMRNRGVEICILGEAEGCNYSAHDLLSMLHRAGLQSQAACDWLLGLNWQLRGQLGPNERPGLCDLLRVALMVRQQQEKGIELRSALCQAATNIYVQNMRSLTARQMVCSILSEEMKKLTSIDSDVLVAPVDKAMVALASDQFQFHSTLVSAQQAACALAVLLSPAYVDRLCPKAVTSVKDFMTGLHTALAIFVSHLDPACCGLAMDWVTNLVEKKMMALLSSLSLKDPMARERDVIKHQLPASVVAAKTCLKDLMGSEAWIKLQEAKQELCRADASVLEYLASQAWDLGNNPQLMDRVAIQMMQQPSQDCLLVSQRLATLASAVCRLQLLHELIVVRERMKDTLRDVVEQGQKVMRQKSDGAKVLWNLCEVLTSVLDHLPDMVSHLTEDKLVLLHQKQDHLLWLPRLLEALRPLPQLLEATRARRNQSLEAEVEVCISQVALHWQWCWNRILSQLITPDSAQALKALVSKVSEMLGDDNSAAKLFVKFWSSWGHPCAFPTEIHAQLWKRFARLCGAIHFDRATSLEVAQPRVKFVVTSTGMSVRRQMLFVAQKLLSGDCDVESDLASIEELLAMHNLVLTESASKCKERKLPPVSSCSLQTQASSIASAGQHVQLWPVYENVGLRAELTYLLGQRDPGSDEARLLCLQEFMGLCSPPAHCFSLSPQLELKFGEKMKWLLQVLQRLWNSPAAAACWQWLTWDCSTAALGTASPVQDTEGPAVFHRSAILYYASHLLSSSRSSENKLGASQYDLLPLNVTLGGLDTQLSLLNGMSQHLWMHAAFLSSTAPSFGHLEIDLLSQTFHSMLEALCCLVDVSKKEEWDSLLDTLNSARGSSLNSSAIFSCLLQVEALLTNHCAWSAHKVCSQHSLLDLIRRCLRDRTEVAGDGSERSEVVGKALVSVGFSLLHLLSPRGPVDPVLKARVKLEHFSEELSGIETDLQVWAAHIKLTTGLTIEETSLPLRHPRLAFLLRRRDELVAVIAELEQRYAFREHSIQYLELSQAVTNFLSYLEQADSKDALTVDRLVDKLSSLMSCSLAQMSLKRAEEALSNEHNWQMECGRFTRKLVSDFPCLVDLAVPVCLAVEEMRLGIRILAQEVMLRLKIKRLQVPGLLSPAVGHLEEVVCTLATFPSVSHAAPTWHHLAAKLSCRATRELVISLTKTCCDTDPAFLAQQMLSRLIRSSLLFLKTHVLQTGEITPDLFTTLTQVLELLVNAWKEQEERRREKEEQEASLFIQKTKMRTHGETRSENEIEEEDYKTSFPMYHEDFADMLEAKRLEDTGKREPSTVDTAAATLDVLTDQEVDEVCQNHLHMLQRLTSASWMPRRLPFAEPAVRGWDILKPALLAYQVATAVGKHALDLLPAMVDGKCLGTHLVVCATVAKCVQSQVSADGSASQLLGSLQPPTPRCYNIYLDSNVEEVVRCRQVLQHVRDKVLSLLQSWPEHPTLRQLLQVVDRIETFPITSPVMKFLFGMELLLEKAQLWESNAPSDSNISMAEQLSEVTDLIMRWRTLELRCWRGALDIEVERSRKKTSRTWFHIYMVISEQVHRGEICREELVGTLKNYLEGEKACSLGEFSARLDILLAFHCQLVLTPPCEQRDELLRILWNVHQYYKHFSPAVEAEIARCRKEKEEVLKGYTKTAGWGASWMNKNYWALKESTEKAHRKVHKAARAFQADLNKPVKSILMADKLSGSVSLEGPNHGEEGKYSERVLACCTRALEEIRSLEAAQQYQSNSSLEVVLGKLHECPLLLKLPSKCRKMVKHWRVLVARSRTCRNITSLDELTGDLLEEAQELQKLEVPQITDGDKKKLKAEIKHIGIRKRKALADCFKQLTSIGLSYRKGLIKEKTSLGNTVWQLAPFNPAACLEKDSHLVGLWEGSEVYFSKCLVRLDRFSEALYSPSRELGADNIQRCQGFVSHLASLYIQQRSELTDTFNYFMLYRKLLSAIDCLRSDTSLPPQTETRQQLSCVKATVTQVCQGVLQFTLLLGACPPPPAHSHPSPLPPSDLPPMSHLRHGDELWTRCFNLLQTYHETAQKLQAKLLALSDNYILSYVDLDVLWGSVAELSLVGEGLQELAHMLEGDIVCLTSALAYLCTVIRDTHASFASWRQTLPGTPDKRQADAAVGRENPLEREDWLIDSEIAHFAAKLESHVKAVLLSIQVSVKDRKSVDKGTVHLEGSLDVDEQDGNGLEENHLMLLCQELHKNFDFLCAEKQAKCLEEVLDELKKMTERNGDASSRSALCARLVVHCLPALRVYGQMLEDHVGKALALHRTLGKMLAVMLAVFTQLALKGFCLPAEFGEEEAGEGASDFVNIESGGIGEGEGAKDVSDQIESEDQLDEARRPGEEKEEGEQKEHIAPEKNAIEMSEDFEADPQDMEPVEGEDNNSDDNDSDEANEDDLDRQMGDVDGPGSEQLDDQMWGSDEEEDSKDQPEEDGPGSGPQGKKELVPQEDLASSTKDDQNKDDADKGDDKESEDGDEQEHQTPDLPQFDESEYDDNHFDPQQADAPEQKEAESLDLPQDLNLDKDEKGEEEDSSEKPPAEEEAAGETPEVNGKDDEGQEEKNEQDAEQGDDSESGAPDKEEKDKEEKDKATPEEEVQEENMEMDTTEDRAEENEENGRKEAKQDNQTDEEENEEESTKGFNAQEASQPEKEDVEDKEEMEEPEERGKSSSDAAGAVQSEEKQDRAIGDNNQEEKEGVGAATSEQEEGHEGSTSTQVTEGSAPHDRTQSQRRPGQSREDRCLGSAEEKFKRLKTIDTTSQQDESRYCQEKQEAELYEHVKEGNAHADAQTLDVATDQQQKDQDVIGEPVEEGGEETSADDDVRMADDVHTEDLNQERKPKDAGTEQQQKPAQSGPEDPGQENHEAEKMEIEGDVVLTHGAERPPDSTIHTQLEHLHLGATMTEVDVEVLRGQLEAGMNNWSSACSSDVEGITAATDAWQKYETLTCSLSQELCEQLRLVLEPSQSTKLRGDYRTGKRLNMRKVIPYIASQFRKDKIWLRRTKPSKRQYQIMLAIDDSSSMADNHSKQMAFESLALIANALTLLETGDLAVCSFGERVKLLHPFTEPFSTQAGARILHNFTFEQTQTDVALLLQQATAAMVEAQSRQQSFMGRPETAQLLVIVSDGRGINAKGANVVKRAVRQAREANIFLVFVILDDPKNKNSILDIRIPIFTTGGEVKMRSYMEEFPFPFYVILRDINSLPQVLSDALRQWFELVTASV